MFVVTFGWFTFVISESSFGNFHETMITVLGVSMTVLEDFFKKIKVSFIQIEAQQIQHKVTVN
jgi:hypothetical protein